MVSPLPAIRFTGAGLHCGGLAAEWSAASDAPAVASIDAGIWEWSGEKSVEFESAAPLQAALVSSALSSFRTENWESGAPVKGLQGLHRRGDLVFHSAGARPRAVNYSGSVLHVFLPHQALALAADAEERVFREQDATRALSDHTIGVLMSLIAREVIGSHRSSCLLAETLIAALAAAVVRASVVAIDVSRGGLAPWAERRCTDLMRDRLADDISLADLASEARLSPFHFARMFKQSVGVAPHAYLVQCRIEKACELLATTDLSVTEIAQAVGYSSSQALNRVFVKAMGATPTAYRRERRS